MQKYVKRMILEHKELSEKIEKLAAYIQNDLNKPDGVGKDSREEYADKVLQLDAMVNYKNCLSSRLARAGINYNSISKKYSETINTDVLNYNVKLDADEI